MKAPIKGIMKLMAIQIAPMWILIASATASADAQCSITQDSSPPGDTERLFVIDDEGFTVNACGTILDGLSNINNSLVRLDDTANPIELYGAVSGWGISSGPSGTLFVKIDDTVNLCGTILVNEIDPEISPGIWNMRTDGTGLQLVAPAMTDRLQKGMCFDVGVEPGGGTPDGRPPRLIFLGGLPGIGSSAIQYIEIDPLTGGPIGAPQIVLDPSGMPEDPNFIDVACDPRTGMIYATDNGPAQRPPGGDGIVWRMDHAGDAGGTPGPENWFVVPGGPGRFSNPLGIEFGIGLSSVGNSEAFIYVLDEDGLWGKIIGGPQIQDPPKKLVSAEFLNGPLDLAFQGADVFWTDLGSGEVRRVDWTTEAVRCYAGSLIHPIGLMAMTAAAPGEPTLVIPSEIPASFGAPVQVPISFTGGGFDIAATTFSVDHEESCLDFDPVDADLDGNLDNVSFSLPPGFEGLVSFAAGDFEGEFDFTIFDFGLPLEGLPGGDLATIAFNSLCEPGDTSIIASVGFSDMPPPTFGDTLGQDIPGRGVDGSVEILSGERGDCNGDGTVSAGDLSACVLEVFDDDGNFWLDAPGGSFEGSPVGCDANGDTVIDAGDLSCKILLIFEGPGACDAARSRRTDWGTPLLSIDKAPQIGDRHAGARMAVNLRSQGWEINSLAFSLDYDESAFAFDPSDKDGDDIPDTIRFDLSASAQVTVSFDRNDTDGELDISIFDPFQVLDRGSGQPLLTIVLKPLAFANDGGAGVGFSRDPAASFGDLYGRSVEDSTSDGRQ